MTKADASPENTGLLPSGYEAARARREFLLSTFVAVVPLLGCAAALGLWFYGVPPSRADLVMLGVGVVLTMFGVEVGYHRYFTHRSFDAHPALAWCLGALGSAAFLGPVIWWATIHRRHHGRTDREGDPHSPHWPLRGARGLWHAHAGWLFRPAHTAMTLTAGEVKDLWKSPRIVAISRLYGLWCGVGVAVPSLVGLLLGGLRGAALGALWGGLVRIFVVSHFVWGINSVGHAFGGRARLHHSGRASNNPWLVLPTFGGGFHANHHDAPGAYTTSHAFWQLDLGGLSLRLLALVGLVTNLKRPIHRAVTGPANSETSR